LLAHGWWFSRGIPASSTTKTGRHDITEILLKVALNKSINFVIVCGPFFLNVLPLEIQLSRGEGAEIPLTG